MKRPRSSIVALAGLTLLVSLWHFWLNLEDQPGLVRLLTAVGDGASPREHEWAIRNLEAMDPYPGDRLVDLLAAPGDSKLRTEVILLVRQYGPRSLNRRFMLADELRDKATIALAEVGRRRGSVRAHLGRALSDRRPRVRYLATLVLAQVRPEREDIPALVGLMDDADPGVRDEALVALAASGVRARDATSRLMGIAVSESYGWSNRSNACVALGQVAARSEPVVQVLQRATTDSDSRVRRAADTALSTLKGAPE
jgi:HEAT repeat protein